MEAVFAAKCNILGSGLRLSEVVGCNHDDLDLLKGLVRVIRKGNKEQYVYFSERALMDLNNYLEVRESRYKPDKSASFLFMAAPVGRKGTNRRLNQRSIEKLVEKYARNCLWKAGLIRACVKALICNFIS